MPAGIVMRPLRPDLGQGETGIGNELWALAGYLLLATRNHALCLPPFTTNVHTTAGECDSTVSAYQRGRGNPCTHEAAPVCRRLRCGGIHRGHVARGRAPHRRRSVP